MNFESQQYMCAQHSLLTCATHSVSEAVSPVKLQQSKLKTEADLEF